MSLLPPPPPGPPLRVLPWLCKRRPALEGPPHRTARLQVQEGYAQPFPNSGLPSYVPPAAHPSASDSPYRRRLMDANPPVTQSPLRCPNGYALGQVCAHGTEVDGPRESVGSGLGRSRSSGRP